MLENLIEIICLMKIQINSYKCYLIRSHNGNKNENLQCVAAKP